MLDLDVVVVDCQTTGANPARGHLLEVAWSRAGRAVSHLVKLPEGQRIPPRISDLTGIRPRSLTLALPSAEVVRRLQEDAAGALLVAHFARFERAFLPTLRGQWVCTHEIACRLLPGLPGRGLRAVAGYFGHVMGEAKRAAAHVRATRAVWEELARRLAHIQVTTLAQLQLWMERVRPTRRAGRDFPFARDARLRLPDAPGVYRMLGRGGQLLYLGKAKSLKRRVSSHFCGKGSKELLTQTFAVDVCVTESPLEAALHEADEIKRCAPPYNVALKERTPTVWFASKDLRSVRPRPDATHQLGPLPQRDSLAEAGTLPELIRRGARLWRSEPEDADELSLKRAAHLVRRARWLARLCESSLVWRPRGRQGLRVLVVDGGRVTVRDGKEGAKAPLPPGHGQPLLERLRCFDPASYDRLRVLTTELRRIVAEGDRVELRLGPHLVLDRRALARRLAWV